ncbi:hypothetical protein DUNSADRAFT_13035 [Dunaliella salina]|uniref:Uncharacterized protein n=1 Tax=Dunaliella salina TaxID=3046 RepID=A0ABQ7GA70_DUNSA|nr:hypothetical protein DUNSADRAFT_13035 [Dunaliella salina]|eukprot:KAF5831504.1 hypothetical protein DUNSADRAFT_13035 [Dunaliella salina]
MNATKRRKAVPVMQNYLRFLITGAPAQWSEAKATTADYRQWAWHVHHKGALRVCAVLSVVIMFLYLRAIEDTPLKLQICGMILLAVFMAVLTVNRLPLPAPAAANWARQAIMLFSVLQCMVTINVAVGARTPGRSLILFCPWWLDVATNLVVDVPCLALGDMRVKSWLVFLCMHVAVGVPFYVSVQGYSLPLAIFKAAVIQGLSLIAYTAIERPMCATYMRHFAETSRQGGAALEGSLWSSNEQEHQEQQKSEGHRRLAMWVAGSSKSADPPPPRFQCKVWSSDPEPLSPSNVSSCSPCKAAAEQPAVGPADVQEGHGDLPGCFAKGSADVQEEHAGGSAGLQEGHGEGHDDVLVGQKEGYGDVQHTGACVELAAAEAAQLPTGWALDLPQKGPVDLAHRGAKNPADLARRAAGTPDAWSADKRQYVSNLRRSTVSIKLRSSFGPEKLSPEAPSRLTQRVASSFPGMMVVDVAVRRGCIVLSMDVCELQRIAQQKGEGQAHGLSQDEMMQVGRVWKARSCNGSRSRGVRARQIGRVCEAHLHHAEHG